LATGERRLRNFRELTVWEKTHELVLEVYRVSKVFPSDERYGLTVQLRRAVVSVASNIAEGCGRGSDKDFSRFLGIAAGSASEAEYQLLLARDLGYLLDDDYRHLNSKINEVKRILNSFIQSLT
jgi:four helix bundle protein